MAALAISDANSPDVHIFDARSGASEAVAVVTRHRSPVTALRYNEPFNTVISIDTKGAMRTCAYTCHQQGASAPPVTVLRYNEPFNTVISIETKSAMRTRA